MRGSTPADTVALASANAAVATRPRQWPPRRQLVLLLSILAFVSIYDMASPPVTSTIWRQTQTAMLTQNFARSDFSLDGLHLDILGEERPRMIYEFPTYNAVVAVLFRIFSPAAFWGKLVSLLSSLASLWLVFELVRRHADERLAIWTGVLFIFSPVGMLVRTGFQPDALALASTLGAVYALDRWREHHSPRLWLTFVILLLLGGLTKFPVLVPYLPLVALAGLFPRGRFRVPRRHEAVSFAILFMVPFVAWYLVRGSLSYAEWEAPWSGMFLVGDLSRFLRASYYVEPFYTVGAYLLCGAGALLVVYGLPRLRPWSTALALGVPLYFVLIPTVADQYYYLYAVTPAAAVLMAAGALRLAQRHGTVGIVVMAVLYAGGFAVATQYALRHDSILLEAAAGVRETTDPGELGLSLLLHDRHYVGGHEYPRYPEAFYLAQRRGWNLSFHPERGELGGMMRALEAYRRAGARWIVVTWYSPEQEPWFAPFIPPSYRRDPHADGSRVVQLLATKGYIVHRGRSHAVLRLKAEVDSPL